MNLSNAREEAQRKQMEDLSRQGICPFCPDHLEKTHREPIERRGAWWSITKNDYPYEGTTTHYLLIYIPHITRLDEISPEAMLEFNDHLAWLSKNIPGGSVVMRWGDTSMTGGSISHLHAHFIVGGPEKEGGEKIKTTVGNKK